MESNNLTEITRPPRASNFSASTTAKFLSYGHKSPSLTQYWGNGELSGLSADVILPPVAPLIPAVVTYCRAICFYLRPFSYEYINLLGSVLITPPVWFVLATNWLPNDAVEANEPLAVPPASSATIYRSSSIYSGLYSPIFLSSSVPSRFYRILLMNISESYYFAKFKLSPSIYTLSTLNKSKTELFGNQALPFVASPSASGILNEKQNSVSAMLIYLPTTDDYSWMLNELPSGTDPSQFLRPYFVYNIFVGTPLILCLYIILWTI